MFILFLFFNCLSSYLFFLFRLIHELHQYLKDKFQFFLAAVSVYEKEDVSFQLEIIALTTAIRIFPTSVLIEESFELSWKYLSKYFVYFFLKGEARATSNICKMWLVWDGNINTWIFSLCNKYKASPFSLLECPSIISKIGKYLISSDKLSLYNFTKLIKWLVKWYLLSCIHFLRKLNKIDLFC